MKTIEELKQLKEELLEAYFNLLNSDTPYEESTRVYAKKCADDAVTAYKFAQFNTFIAKEPEEKT